MAGNVLIVDGSSTAALRAQLILERAGYRVSLASDGEEGLNKVLEEAPDLVVLDTILPRSSGYEVFGRLKIDPKTEGLPVVLAADESELTKLEGEVGFHPERFVAKPYDPSNLLPLVDAAVDGGNGHKREDGQGQSMPTPSLPGVGQITIQSGRIAAADEQAAQLLGQPADALVGSRLDELLRDGQQLSEFVDSLESDEIRWQDCDVSVNGDGGLSRWRVCAAPLGENGASGARLSLIDISEYGHIEKKLEEVKQAAAGATRTRSRFLANMSHELRTPLHEIIGMLDLSIDGRPAEEQSNYLATARASADALLTIVSDVLEFSELEAGELELEEEAFDLEEPIRRVAEVVRPRAEEKGLQFSCHVAGGVPTAVYGASRRLRQVLDQLVGNAVKFTDRGQVSLWVEAEGYSNEEVELHFRVRDTGCGIAEEEQHLIFEAFRQADDSATRQFGGLGLGLAMSRHLVELMGGQLWVESEVGKGSTFHFVLPFGVPKEKEEAKKPLSEAAGEGELELKILVAEDSPTNQLIARKNLEKAGHRVTIANNGLEAVEAAERETWDLVLMDVAMPEMDGLEATRTIREAEEASGDHVPIIATTAFATKDYQDKCMAAGMDGYVSKPVSVEELYATIEPFLAAKAAEEAAEPEPELPPAVDFEAALEVVGGDEELLEAVSEMSLGEIPEQFKRLQGAVANQDAAAVEAAAHRLKGVLANLGGILGRDAAQKLETMGETGDLDGADEACRELEAETKRVIAFYMDYDW
jgi:signal transduction histidine kinase/response regulator of citrate/malate metabolism